MSSESATQYCEVCWHQTLMYTLLLWTNTVDEETCERPKFIPTTEAALQEVRTPRKDCVFVVMTFAFTDTDEFVSVSKPGAVLVIPAPTENPPNR